MPEYRRWLKEPFRGHFVGVHGLGGEYNIAGVGPTAAMRDRHYEGWFVGGGLTYGYAWRLSDHWNLEAAIGVGYLHVKYSKYENEHCGRLLDNGKKNYVGPTKLALNIAYVFGKKAEPVVVEPVVEPVVVKPYEPHYQLAYMEPKAEVVKARSLSGQAFLDFVVNKTDICRDYRGNANELRKVEETINVVRHDPNTTITHIDIHGYASPEGSFQNNTRLAVGRAQAFKDYVQALIDLPASVFSVASTPEDWEGLLRQLDNEELFDHQAEVKAVAASQTEPDQKERQLKAQYPAQWKHLLAEVFPALRHSDYRVSYTVRPFTVEEAKTFIHTKPQQLSLNEMFLVAQTYTPGSQDYNDVFETAVRMYPDDETANLNAAVIALNRDDLQAAARYLAKAGSTAEALNARGVLAVKKNDHQAAEDYFSQAYSLKEAQQNLDELQKYIHSIQ